MPKSRRTTPEMLQRSRELRDQETPAEEILWSHLRARRLDGIHFRRQHAIGSYIVDFCAASRRLVIELDGGVHQAQAAQDAERTRSLESRGYRVIRFRNSEVMERLERVLEKIREVAQGRKAGEVADG